MANADHAKIVKQGAEAISEWRKINPDDRLDLRGAKLSEQDLRKADLHNADLADADLSGSKLRLSYLYWADLTGADLSGTDLVAANLDGATLRNANFTDVRCGATIFADLDLSEVRGLDTVQHLGPSTVGVDTLCKSMGQIPEGFLRGCGVPHEMVSHLLSIAALKRYHSCFISYSRKDKKFCDQLYERMTRFGATVFIDKEHIRGGRESIEEIERAIRTNDKLLLVLSKNSMTSEWVKTEIRIALRIAKEQGRKKLFPIRLASVQAIKRWTFFDSDTGTDLAVQVRKYHIPDFSEWKKPSAFDDRLRKLLNDLQKDATR